MPVGWRINNMDIYTDFIYTYAAKSRVYLLWWVSGSGQKDTCVVIVTDVSHTQDYRMTELDAFWQNISNKYFGQYPRSSGHFNNYIVSSHTGNWNVYQVQWFVPILEILHLAKLHLFRHDAETVYFKLGISLLYLFEMFINSWGTNQIRIDVISHEIMMC